MNSTVSHQIEGHSSQLPFSWLVSLEQYQRFKICSRGFQACVARCRHSKNIPLRRGSSANIANCYDCKVVLLYRHGARTIWSNTLAKPIKIDSAVKKVQFWSGFERR